MEGAPSAPAPAAASEPAAAALVPAMFDPEALFLERAARRTLAQFIVQSVSRDGARGDRDLALLMNSIAHACKVVGHAIRRAGISDLYGLAGVENATGDEVKKLDILANDIWISALKNSGVCSVLVSEENEEAIIIKEDDKLTVGPFCVAFDPLDGSSNIDCNVSVGSIFSVYKREGDLSREPSVDDILRPGNQMVAAGYCMYGAATELVIAVTSLDEGGKVSAERFQMDPSIGEFMFIETLKFPQTPKKIYSCNEGNSSNWDPAIKEFVEFCKGSGFSARYVGSMVSDVHRSLLYGGIFLYPADAKSRRGKLRVLYEGFPMALITEAAGGQASTGMLDGKVQRILEYVPRSIHDKCPIIMGCNRDVDMIHRMIDSHAKAHEANGEHKQ